MVVEPKEVEKKPQIDIGKEAAMEAEVRAARERALVPLDTRIKSFREMLTEKEVWNWNYIVFFSTSKWYEQIVFDDYYVTFQ